MSCAVLRIRWLKPYTRLVDRHVSLCFLVTHVFTCSILLPHASTFSSSVFKISCFSVDEIVKIYFCQTRWNIYCLQWQVVKWSRIWYAKLAHRFQFIKLLIFIFDANLSRLGHDTDDSEFLGYSPDRLTNCRMTSLNRPLLFLSTSFHSFLSAPVWLVQVVKPCINN